MCAYKLCRVEFKLWGMQNRIEQFIHDSALRRVMVRAHRQAWAWQDEWIGLTMDDIRKLEKETQEHLAKTMANSEDRTNLPQRDANENDNAGATITDEEKTADHITHLKDIEISSKKSVKSSESKVAEVGSSDDEFVDAE